MNPIIGIASLITALLILAHFISHPVVWPDVKAALRHFNHWVRNEDGEHIKTYLIAAFALVVGVVWGLSLL